MIVIIVYIILLLAGYPASLGFPIMHPNPCDMHPLHNCHHIKVCLPRVK